MNLLESLTNSFNTVFEQISAGLFRLIPATLILVLGWLISKIAASVVSKILTRLGLEKLGDKLNATAAFKDSGIKLKPVVIIKKFVYWTLMLIFVLSATEFLGLEILTQQIAKLIAFIPDLLTAFIILAVGFYLAGAVREMVANACKSFGISAWKFISGIIFFLLMMVVVVTAFGQIGIDVEVLTTNEYIILGGLLLGFAIAYGHAARPVLSNILSSFYAPNNFRIGQNIELDNIKGSISRMDNISVTIDTGDREVIFPLRRLMEDKVTIYK
ncbi:MAG: hypothetical protein AAGD28_11465 [Bacteroidota bacterium]